MKKYCFAALRSFVVVVAIAFCGAPPAPATPSSAVKPPAPANHHYLYVAAPGVRNYLQYGGHGLLVFDMDNQFKFVKRIATGGLDDKGQPSNVLDARTGDVLHKVVTHSGSHNTIYGPDGQKVYLEGLRSNYLTVVRTSDYSISQTGPFFNHIRPFTIDSRQQRCYVNCDSLLGFEVGDLRGYTCLLANYYGHPPGRDHPTEGSAGMDNVQYRRKICFAIDGRDHRYKNKKDRRNATGRDGRAGTERENGGGGVCRAAACAGR